MPSVESRNPNGGVREGWHDDTESVAVKPALKQVALQDGAQNVHTKSNAPLPTQDTQHLPSPSLSPSPTSSPSTDSVLRVIPGTSVGLSGTPSSLSIERRYSGSYASPAISDVVSQENGNGVFSQPLPTSQFSQPHNHHISDEMARRPKALVIPKLNGDDKVFKLTAAEMEELTSAPDSLPRSSLRSPTLPDSARPPLAPSPILDRKTYHRAEEDEDGDRARTNADPLYVAKDVNVDRRAVGESTPMSVVNRRPGLSSRRLSSPQVARNRVSSYTRDPYGHTSPKRRSGLSGSRPGPLDLDQSKPTASPMKPNSLEPPPSPVPQSIPLPPMSIPTYLQLELSSSKPSPLYIYQSSTSENVYESSRIKFERLLNFLLLPPQLEQILYFGTLACLDAWLYTFTILPLRFLKAATVLIRWWGQTLAREIRFIAGFIYHGSGRMWHRQRGLPVATNTPIRSHSVPRARRPQVSTPSYYPQSARTPDHPIGSVSMEGMKPETERKSRQGWGRKHRRVKSQPSLLMASHKADLLQGAVIICSCIILMKLDASRMYHSIRGQAAIKLYVIYNVLEVCDKLFAALGQDIFECLFSNETLERNIDGRSKILRPFGMFILALIYNVIHAAALLYQVITLNVAVNSYSNALLTLLMSNQFVEIKSSVFKKIEKDNLFQLTCADVVERFQLWLMLMIIALRNIVEVGGLSILNSSSGASGADSVKESIPIRSYSILPNSFTILPSWTGEVLSPFLLVLGSEMLVDWIKHAYINKFNNVKPAIYQRYLDVLAKDYYTNAFMSQNLIKRLGLPVIPLSCLFIRSSFQTYHMFLATHLPPPIPSSATELAVESATTSPATMAAFEHFDTIIRKALGRSAYGIPDPTATNRWYLPSADDVIAALTMLIFFLGAFFVLLAFKLVLGMLLLKFSRNRYRNMKSREFASYDTGGRRLGGWGIVEVDEAKRRWFYDDDPDALKRIREKERAAKERQENNAGAGQDFGKISRYEMVKRIW